MDPFGDCSIIHPDDDIMMIARHRNIPYSICFGTFNSKTSNQALETDRMKVFDRLRRGDITVFKKS